jgi:hypothetical protein
MFGQSLVEVAAKDHLRSEERLVKLLLQRFSIPANYKFKMLDLSYRRTDTKALTLDVFFECFPTFPARLVLPSTEGYEDSASEDDSAFSTDVLFDSTSRPVLKPFGLVFRSKCDRGGGLVLHNQLIDVDIPGSRLFWVNAAGQQLVIETWEVFLDTLDKAAPGGNGWLPEPAV